MMQKKLDTTTIPFRGGCDTFQEPALLVPGKYSAVQNFRQMHPGLKKRPGQIKLHTTADSTNRVMSLFQFSKGKITERHFYAQMSDGDVLEATNAPPTVTTGAFGAEVFSGSASSIPASWAVLNDTLLYCNGVDAPQIYAGTGNYVEKCYVYKGSRDPMTVKDFSTGADYSIEVSDGDTSTYADISSLQTLAETLGAELVTNGAFAADTDWTKTGTATIAAGKLELATTSDNAYQTISQTSGEQYKLSIDIDAITGTVRVFEGSGYNYVDYTTAGTKSDYYVSNGTTQLKIQQQAAGASTIDNVSVKKPAYHCFFVKTPVAVQSLTFTVSAANGTDAVAVVKYWDGDSFADAAGFSDGTASAGKTLAVTGAMTWTAPTDEKPCYLYGSFGYWYMIYLSSGSTDSETRVSAITYSDAWGSMANLWDGEFVDVIEAQFYDQSAEIYYTYGAEDITLNSMTTTDELYFSSLDDIESIQVEVLTPNGTGDTLSLYRWDGSGWQSVSIYDGTAGFVKSGRIIFARGSSKAQDFNLTGYMAHWYKIMTSGAFGATVSVALQAQPYFSISDYGKSLVVAAWKNRAVYAFDRDPNYVYISAESKPQVLNGDDFDIKKAGDGRINKIVFMKPFYNELMVFQAEKGVEGGLITLFDGYDPDTFGRLVLSSKYGTMNAQSAEIVEGFNFGGNKDTGLIAFFLSRHGVMYTEGKTVSHVPSFNDIKNYFDPTNSGSIRQGYESQMWLKYDSAFNILRIGLVTGSSATVCNTFLTYDLADLTWGTDSYAQELSAFTECEAASGTAPVLQVGGGVDDGQVYLLNSGLDDVSTAIDSYVTPEYDTGGDILHMDEMMLRMKVQSAGTITVTPSLNSIAQTSFTLAQTAETTNQTIRRHKKSMDLTSQHISLKIQHSTAAQSCYLEDMRLKIRELTER